MDDSTLNVIALRNRRDDETGKKRDLSPKTTSITPFRIDSRA